MRQQADCVARLEKPCRYACRRSSSASLHHLLLFAPLPQELEGVFSLPPGERQVLLSVVRKREIGSAQRQWIDIEHPVSTVRPSSTNEE